MVSQYLSHGLTQIDADEEMDESVLIRVNPWLLNGTLF
jgi:hypothetical protein